MDRFINSKRNNGIEVIAMQEPYLHSACIGLYFSAGTIYETKSINGISHLIEHLCFRRMADLLQKQLYFELESLGSTLRGKTYANFLQFDVTVSKKYLKEAFDIICRILYDFEWNITDINLERSVVLKQIEYKSTPFNEYVNSLYFKNLRYEMPIMGTVDSVGGLSPNVINRWKRQIIRTDNLCFVLTGNYSDCDYHYVLDKLDAIPSRNTVQLKHTERTPSMFCKRTSRSDVVIEADSEISDISITFDIDSHKLNPYAVDILSSILGGGNGSKLSMVLRETYALTDEIFSRVDSYPELRKLTIEFSTDNSDLRQSLALAFSEISKLKTHINNDDLLSSISFFTENQYWLLDDPQMLNFSFGLRRMGLKQNVTDLGDIINRYKQVTIDELIGMANKVFVPRNLTIIVTNNDAIFRTRSLKRLFSVLRDMLN